MKNIAVFFGGKSVEHDVSIITGVLTLNALDKTKYNAIPIYVDKEGTFYTGEILRDLDGYKNLKTKRLKKVALLANDNTLYQVKMGRLKALFSISTAINCMHGERGEDGSLAGLLNMSGIAFCSPDLLCSSVAMSKTFTKIFLKGLGVKAVKSVSVTNANTLAFSVKDLTFPLIVKPDRLGSSIGISTVDDLKSLKDGVLLALRYGKRAIIEQKLENFKEINCSAYRLIGGGVKVSECERPIGKGETLLFSDKYEEGDRIFPADIDKKTRDKIQKTTKKIYEALQADGVIRIDYMVKEKEVFVNEINTVPGSLAYYLYGDKIADFSKMLDEMLLTASKKYGESESFIKTFNSGILKPFGAKGVKHL